VCADWEVAADMRKEQTSFFLVILSCSHLLPSHVDMMRMTHCPRFVIAAKLDATARLRPAVEPVFQMSQPPEKIHGLQSDCYDRTSRQVLLTNPQGSCLCPKSRTWRF